MQFKWLEIKSFLFFVKIYSIYDIIYIGG